MAARQHRKNEAYTVCTMAGRKQYADEVLSQLLVRQQEEKSSHSSLRDCQYLIKWKVKNVRIKRRYLVRWQA